MFSWAFALLKFDQSVLKKLIFRVVVWLYFVLLHDPTVTSGILIIEEFII